MKGAQFRFLKTHLSLHRLNKRNHKAHREPSTMYLSDPNHELILGRSETVITVAGTSTAAMASTNLRDCHDSKRLVSCRGLLGDELAE